MNPVLRSPILWVVALLTILPILASCTPDASGGIISPQLGPQLVAAASGDEIQVEAPEAAPLLVDLTVEEIYAGLPDAVVQAVQNADPGAGEQLALTNACSGCHAVDPEQTGLAGPMWVNLGNTAVERALVTGSAGPADYIHSSIIAPNAYVVPGYNAGVMPQTYEADLSDEELGTLIAYILGQQQGE